MNERETPDLVNLIEWNRFAEEKKTLLEALTILNNRHREAVSSIERERDEAREDLAEERHAWEKEREDWQADYAAVAPENKAMREAIEEAAEAFFTWNDVGLCKAWLDSKDKALAKLKPFLA